MNIGNKISEGGCSEVYPIGEDRVLKLAKANTDYVAMKKEYDNNRLAYHLGLPVAKPHEMVTIDGRSGIIFDRIYGVTLKELFFNGLIKQAQDRSDGTPFFEDNIRLTARLLSQIHRHTNVEHPYTQTDRLKDAIRSSQYLTQADKVNVYTLLDALPKKYCLCHGDPNPGNIMLTEEGNPIIIDWMDASIGNPEADLAEYIIMIRYAILPPTLPPEAVELFDKIRETVINIFMDEYTRLTGVTYEEVIPWLVPMSARKLVADAIPEEEKDILLQEIRKAIS